MDYTTRPPALESGIWELLTPEVSEEENSNYMMLYWKVGGVCHSYDLSPAATFLV